MTETKNQKLRRTMTQIRDEAGNTVLALARLCIFHEKNIAQIRADMLKSKAGSKTRLDYLRALGKETRDHVALIQSLGYFPRDLGIQTITNYQFKASIGLGGEAQVVLAPPTLEAEFKDYPQLEE